LLVAKANGRLAITLNRPEVANALTSAQCDQLVVLLEAANTDPEVRVITLSATGRHFCGGMDLGRSRDGVRDDKVGSPSEVGSRLPGASLDTNERGAQRLIKSVLDCLKPVVAVVEGPSAGLGFYLVLASDLVVATENASFVEAFHARGMVLHCGGAHLLVQHLGMHRAKELVFFGGRLSAAEAQELGFVNRLVRASDLDSSVEELVSQLTSAPTMALGLSKRLLNHALGSDRETALFEEAMAMEINSATHDYAEGVAAFKERRQPTFTGR
jgi:2-(1,2-epoxy-1,2-dihydrophenyl)acetyl-CoA isomerase